MKWEPEGERQPYPNTAKIGHYPEYVIRTHHDFSVRSALMANELSFRLHYYPTTRSSPVVFILSSIKNPLRSLATEGIPFPHAELEQGPAQADGLAPPGQSISRFALSAGQTMPCAIIALATFMKPATLAPLT